MECINKGSFKNLTVGKDYPVLKEEDGKIVVINDMGIESKYSKRYFAKAKTTRSTPPPPPPPPPIPPINTPEIGIDHTSNGLTVRFEGIVSGGNVRINKRADLEVKQTAGNCGIYDIAGITILVEAIGDWYQDTNPRRISSSTEVLEAIKDTLKHSVERILNEFDMAFCIFSSNTSNDIVMEVMNSICEEFEGSVISPIMENPNSGNDILFWAIALTMEGEPVDDSNVEEN